MLTNPTSTSLSSVLLKLASDGSNWIIWKTRIQVFLGAKKLAHVIDKSASLPEAPTDLATDAKETEIKEHKAKADKVVEWLQVLSRCGVF